MYKKILFTVITLIVCAVIVFVTCFFAVPEFNAWVKGEEVSDTNTDNIGNGDKSNSGGNQNSNTGNDGNEDNDSDDPVINPGSSLTNSGANQGSDGERDDNYRYYPPDVWVVDSSYHWHYSADGAVIDKASHTYKNGVCTVCRAINIDGHAWTENGCRICGAKWDTSVSHTHCYSSKWYYNITSHFKAAMCGCNDASEMLDHTFENDICTVCGFCKAGNYISFTATGAGSYSYLYLNYDCLLIAKYGSTVTLKFSVKPEAAALYEIASVSLSEAETGTPLGNLSETSDGVYQFSMPNYNVLVTVELRSV